MWNPFFIQDRKFSEACLVCLRLKGVSKNASRNFPGKLYAVTRNSPKITTIK